MKKLLQKAAIVAGAAAGVLAMALPAGATINPTVIANANAAGAYVAPTALRQADGDRINGARATFYLLAAAKFDTTNTALWNPSTDLGGSTAKGGALTGVQLCHALTLTSSTETAVIFTQWNSASGLFDVFVGHSSSADCLQAEGGATGIHQIDTIAPGHRVFLAITQGHFGTIFFTDEDLTNNTGAQTTFGGFSSIAGFNRGGIGSNSGIDALNAPPSVKLVRFTSERVRDTDVGWANPGGTSLTRLVTQKVEQATTPSDVFVSPVLTSTALKLIRGTLNS